MDYTKHSRWHANTEEVLDSRQELTASDGEEHGGAAGSAGLDDN